MRLLKLMRLVAAALPALVVAVLVSCVGMVKTPVCADCSSAPTSPTGNLSSTGGSKNASILGGQASPSFHVTSVWTEISYHGALVIAAGYDYTLALVGNMPCSACHAGNSPTQPSPNLRAPNCFACHDGGPDGSAFHPWGWNDPGSRLFHGDLVIAAGYDYAKAPAGNLPCIACHAGLSPEKISPNSRAPNCFACHGGGPDGSAGHPPGWGDPKSTVFHGIAAVANGFRSTDFKQATTGNLACSACHAGDGPLEVSVNSRAPNCYACHAGGPDGSPGHPPGWENPSSPKFHGGVVAAANFDYTKAKSGNLTCNVCHAGESPSQVSPVSGAPNCFACHAGGPTGSSGHPPGWTDLTNPKYHGAVVEAAGGYTLAKSGTLTCNACHAGESPSQVSPVSGAPNCFACHEGGPDGSPGHPTGWRSPSLHGSVVASASFDYTKAKSGNLTCNVCHAGESPSQVSPVPEAPSCFACHDGGPTGARHPAGWENPRSSDFHGVYLAQNGGYQNALSNRRHCDACHNTTSNGPSPVLDAPNCFICHNGGPSGSPGHPSNWKDSDAQGVTPHGTAAQADLVSCSRCHNTVAPGIPNPAPDVPVDCWSCHLGPGG